MKKPRIKKTMWSIITASMTPEEFRHRYPSSLITTYFIDIFPLIEAEKAIDQAWEKNGDKYL